MEGKAVEGFWVVLPLPEGSVRDGRSHGLRLSWVVR